MPLPNKRLKLPAPGLGTNCVCAPANCVLVSTVVAPVERRRRSLSAPAPLNSQVPKTSRVSVELGIGAATFNESFASDCCGPTREASGSAFSIRIKRHTSRLIEVGAEAGASVTPRPDMRWLMMTGAIAPIKRLAPWAQMGAGVVSQPGECPADAPDTSPDCTTALTLGAIVGAGIRWSLLSNLAIGLEAAFVTGTTRGERRFSTGRYGVTLRFQ
jgi:hypothetical protein